jgi:hypothetical protein
MGHISASDIALLAGLKGHVHLEDDFLPGENLLDIGGDKGICRLTDNVAKLTVRSLGG